MWLFNLREYLHSSLWFIPAMCVTGAIALAQLLVMLDKQGHPAWMERITFQGDAENARTFLTTISSSMITFTGLVFTITIVVLQLASQQFSPRVLRTFLRDRQSQLAMGVFVATFTYAIVVLRQIRSPAPGPEFVPNISITVGFLFVLLSLAVFVAYIHHISQSIRVGKITESISAETRATIADIYDHDFVRERVKPPTTDPSRVLNAPKAGVVTALDRDSLRDAATTADCVLEVVPAVGDFVPEGAPLIRIYGDPQIDDDIVHHVGIAQERTMEQDVAFGFRQLVDIAQKALSPAVNDPTTAVQAIDEMHDLLRRLVTRPFPIGQRFDSDGALRLMYPVMTWKGYVSLACAELRHYGATSIQVMRRMRAMLEDLREIAPGDRLRPIETELKLLDAAVERSWPDLEDRRAGLAADHQGVGD